MATLTPSAVLPNDVWGSQESRLVLLQPTANDYATGGYSLTPGQGVSLGQVVWAICVGNPSPYVLNFNPATGKMIVYGSGGGTPTGTIVTTLTTATNATATNPLAINGGAVTSTTGEVGVTGFTSTFTGAAGAGGALVQVAAGTNLSAYSFLLLVNGY